MNLIVLFIRIDNTAIHQSYLRGREKGFYEVMKHILTTAT